MELLLNGAKALVTEYMEMAEILNALFISVFSGKANLEKCKVLERGARSGIRKTYPWWKWVRLENT